jgi:hypothetical protein
LADETLVRRSATLLEAEVDGELVALEVDTGTCYGFNEPAARIWALIEEPKTLGAIQEALLDQFDIDAATCEADVLALVDQLEADGLVTRFPAP